ncbi:MAG: c-type cytochrome [Crocinitomicaceae bacterium]|nr:c-type cytochrome [Crocinitomicaceae bacterium]
MFRKINKWCVGALTVVLMTGTFNAKAQPDGATLFKKCATCHSPFKDGTGPKLKDVRAKWADGGAKEGSINQWVRNWEAAAAADPYAASVAKVKPTNMDKFPALTDEEIDAIFNYVDAQEEPVAATAAVDGGSGGAVVEEEPSIGWIWIILGIVFVTIILSVGGVRRQLTIANAEQEGKDVEDAPSYGAEFKAWAWKNRKYVGMASLVIVISLVVSLFLALYSIDVREGYQPSQPIDFLHSVHAGINGIDCKYCHNSVTESRTAGLPSVNVCMNCHKQVTGTTPEQQEKIKKIYEAAGWDGSVYTGQTKEIIWNKVHVLPDHVYFNHSQHVVAGGVDCIQCHGDMKTMKETAKVQPVSELNKLEGNVKLTKPTLTMGWCIECHDQKGISEGPLDTKGDGYYAEIHRRLLNNDPKLYQEYLKDGKVSVKELGGWECAKCHY